MNEWLQAHALVLGSLILCAGLDLSIHYCLGFRLVFYRVFISIVPLCYSQAVNRCCDVIAEAERQGGQCFVETDEADYLLTCQLLIIFVP